MTLLLFIISIIPIFIILIGLFIVIFNRDKKFRKSLTFEILLLALILNTILLIYYTFTNTIQRLFYLNFEKGTLFLIELILFSGIIVSLFSKDEIDLTINENIHDGLILIIFLGICCFTLSINIVVISFWLIFILVFIGMIFFYSDYYKSLKLLRFYIIGVIICIFLLFLSCLFIFIEYNTLILLEVPINTNYVIFLLLLISMAIPCGFFPFLIYHLKNFFKESSYTNLLLYLIFSMVNSFQIIRILTIFSLTSLVNAFILIILSFIGIIISIIFILKELFDIFEGATFSIKKLFGYFICADFNIIIFIFSLMPILNYLGIKNDYYNMIIFFIIINFMIKLHIFYSFYPIMIETTDDNLKRLGDFWMRYRKFGILYLISGFIIAIYYSFTILNSNWILLSTNSIFENSLFSNILLIIVIIFILYIFINLIFISISFILIYFGNKPEYLQREILKEIKSIYILPNILLLGSLIFFFLLFLYEYNFYYYWFSNFFLYIN